MNTRARILLLLLALSLMASFAHAETDPPLKSGSQGEAVIQLQDRLRQLGYLHGLADGVYGKQTLRAVEAFQKASGLKTDGIASAELQTTLFREDTPAATVYIAPHGRRYHAREKCLGLRLATGVTALSFTEAKEIRTPCILCYGRQALRLAEEEKEAALEALPTATPSPDSLF